MIRNVTPDQVRNSIDELLDSVIESNDLVIIERQGEAIGALVNNVELQHILGRRGAVEAWTRLDAIAKKTPTLTRMKFWPLCKRKSRQYGASVTSVVSEPSARRRYDRADQWSNSRTRISTQDRRLMAH